MATFSIGPPELLRLLDSMEGWLNEALLYAWALDEGPCEAKQLAAAAMNQFQQLRWNVAKAAEERGLDSSPLWAIGNTPALTPETEAVHTEFWAFAKRLEVMAAIERDAGQGGEQSPAVNLSPAEQDLIDTIREIGPKGRLRQKDILDLLAKRGKVPSEGTTKLMLAALVRHGVLLPGYRLPEWGQ